MTEKDTNKAKALNEAIVNKLDSVLRNTEFIDGMYITIQGERGVMPTITYKITEFITPNNTPDDITSTSKEG